MAVHNLLQRGWLQKLLDRGLLGLLWLRSWGQPIRVYQVGKGRMVVFEQLFVPPLLCLLRTSVAQSCVAHDLQAVLVGSLNICTGMPS